MRLLVCFKAVPGWDKVLERDWQDFAPDSDIRYAGHVLNCFDESALELALRLKDAAAQSGRQVVCAAATVGPLAPGFAQSLYAAGFDEVVRIPLDDCEFAPARVAGALAALARQMDAQLVLTGWAAGMADTGTVPFWLAEELGWPVLPEALGLEWADSPEDGVAVTMQNRQGVWLGQARLPLVVSVGNSTAVLRAVPLRARLQAKDRAVVERVFPAPPANGEEVRLLRPHTARQCRMLPPQPLDAAARAILEVFQSGGGASDADGAASKAGQALPPGLSVVACQPREGAPGLPQPLLDALVAGWQARRPDLTLLPFTAAGRQMLVHLAARTGCNSMTDVIALEWRDGRLFARKKACASHLEWERALALPAIVCLTNPPTGVETVLLDGDAPEWLSERRLLEPARGSGLENARQVVLCGAGLGSRDNCEKARVLAQKLGAAFGITRGALLNGWGGPQELVGQSGLRLAPAAALVLGASGAGAFMTGIEQAGQVLAVNRDPGALVFAGADAGLCADAPALVEAMLSILERG